MKNKKIFTKDQLQKKADATFKQYPNAKQVFATSDGNVFLELNRANIHAGKGTVVTFDRPLEKESDDSKKDVLQLPAAKDQIASIKAAKTAEQLEAFKTDERKSVVTALEEKLKELNPLQ